MGPIGPVFLAQKMRAIVVSAECFAGTGDSNPQRDRKVGNLGNYGENVIEVLSRKHCLPRFLFYL